MNLLIIGGSGKLGKQLITQIPDSLHPNHSELDILNKFKVNNYFKNNKPDVIIHCAALTSIRECENNKEKAWSINVEGTKNLIDACFKYNIECYFIYISTACVFRGDKGCYVETDVPYPKNFYSLTKLIGETVIKSSQMKNWLIIRTNFAAREKWPYPKAFVDRYGTYLFADDLAQAIISILNKKYYGILHVCGDEKVSMYQLAKMTSPDVEPLTIKEYEGPPLTMDMSLKSNRIAPFKLTL